MNQILLFLTAALFLNPASSEIFNNKIPATHEEKSELEYQPSLQSSLDQPDKNNLKNDPDNKIGKSSCSEIISTLTRDEYNISYDNDLRSYQSPNRANNIRFMYSPDGFSATVRENKFYQPSKRNDFFPESKPENELRPDWEISLKLSGCSRYENEGKQNSVLFSGEKLIVEKNRAWSEDNNVRIDFTNTEKGMREDFTIKNKIAGEGKLLVDLIAKTELDMRISDYALQFNDEKGNELLRYAQLKVWDATGKTLNAYFDIPPDNSLKPTETGKQFCIVIEDEDAVYPLTVDPTSISPSWISEGSQNQSGYGYSVSEAGDINNDGYSDVIIGALFYDNGQTDEGKVFVYYGSPVGLLPVAAWSAEGNQPNAQFGNSVSCAGDINNDGYSDVIIGANVFDHDQEDEGKVFVYYGSILGLSLTPNWTSESNQTGSQFGWSVSSAGDVNNDGYDDVIIGAPLYSNDQANEGRAFVYHGSASGLSAAANWTGECNQTTGFYGYSVAGAGDVNGDGFSDIIVGANTYDNPRRDEGKVYLYKGSSSGVSPTMTWTPTSISFFFANFGASVAGAGDVNNDGYDDVIVGAFTFDNVETDEGKAYLYKGSASGLSLLPSWVAEGNQVQSHFGHCVSSAGDVNNDGYDDVIVGAKNYDNGQTNEGGAFLFYGSSAGLSLTANAFFESDQPDAYFGISVSSAGDVNGDGFSDIIAGSYLYDNGQSDEGGAFVYHGSAASTKTLTLRSYIQGYYNTTTNLMIQDTIRVYLRSTSPPHAAVDSANAIISPSGFSILNFSGASNGVNYFIHIKHRNSIETWSSSGHSFTGDIMNYNFSTDSSQAYGNNMPMVDFSPITFALYGGDIDQNGIINLNDIITVSNNSSEFVSGYVNTDLSGDNITNLTDILIAYNNSNAFVNEIHP